MNIFRGRPYGRLVRQLDDARHTLITETAKAEAAQAKADLAKAQIARLEAWIQEQNEAHQRRQRELAVPPMPRQWSYQDHEFGPVIPQQPEADYRPA